MIAKLVLDKKREGRALGSAEIREFVEGFTRGEIPDYQMSAFAMAVCCRGMTQRETADLTETMMNSGRVLSWDGIVTADKHSTGGVGDKLSLIIQSLAAACDVAVPSLTGRGLGFTGGTADKLETIPGYNASLSLDDFSRIVRTTGVSMTVQTDEITPADKKLYALRDVTGTVASIPLITASILSKKLAEGAGTLIFDVKCGSGAFMKTRDEALALAGSLVEGARSAGRKAAALVTDMSAPLGRAVGNANEVAEALAVLKGSDDPRLESVRALSVELASLMVSLARQGLRSELQRQEEDYHRYIKEAEEMQHCLEDKLSQKTVLMAELFKNWFASITKLLSVLVQNGKEETKNKKLRKEVTLWQEKYYEGNKAYREVEKLVNRYNDDAMMHFRQEMEWTEEADYRRVCYFFAGFSIHLIAILMGETEDSVYQKRHRLRKYLETSDLLYKDLYLVLLCK